MKQISENKYTFYDLRRQNIRTITNTALFRKIKYHEVLCPDPSEKLVTNPSDKPEPR